MEASPLEIYRGACAREGVEPDEHIADVLASVTPSKPLLELTASERVLGRNGAAALAGFLAEDTMILQLKVESCELFDAGFQHVCEGLSRHPSVFRLDAGYNGIRALKPAARLINISPSLLCLDLSGNSLAPSLLGWSPLAPLGEALASDLCRLQLLQVGNCDVGMRGVEALVEGLERNRSVVNLVMDENKLGPRSAPAIARLLTHNRTLTSLDLRHNQLRNEGIDIIAPAVEANRSLGCLVLWNNAMSPAGAARLAAAVEKNQGLEVLDIGANLLGFHGADMFKAALGRNQRLHTLGLASCQLGSEGIIAMAEALEGNPRLRRIDLRRNEIGLAGLMALAAAMKTNDRLHDLAIDKPDHDGTGSAGAAGAEDVAPMAEEDMALRADLIGRIAAACDANAAASGGASAPRSLQKPQPPQPRHPAEPTAPVLPTPPATGDAAAAQASSAKPAPYAQPHGRDEQSPVAAAPLGAAASGACYVKVRMAAASDSSVSLTLTVASDTSRELEV